VCGVWTGMPHIQVRGVRWQHGRARPIRPSVSSLFLAGALVPGRFSRHRVDAMPPACPAPRQRGRNPAKGRYCSTSA
jgi:hypothetical protein